mgnify:FL=1
MFFVKWDDSLTPKVVSEKRKTLEEWLRIKTKNKNVIVRIEG